MSLNQSLSIQNDHVDNNALTRIEFKLWETWKVIYTYPEFNSEILANNNAINDEFCRKCKVLLLLCLRLAYVVYNTVFDKVKDSVCKDDFIASKQSKLPSQQPLSYYIHNRCLFIHWIYSKRCDLRATIRQLLYEALLFKGQAMSSPTVDAGNSRDHVNDLLKLLLTIIDGFIQPLSVANRDIMSNILIPLHLPNEMIDWRDQLPVIQLYHESLVKCCLKLIDKDKHQSESMEIDNASNDSLFVCCFNGILNSWPTTKEANTTKEILLLHEIELLLKQITSIDEYVVIQSAWLVSLRFP